MGDQAARGLAVDTIEAAENLMPAPTSARLLTFSISVVKASNCQRVLVE